ncbi:MAG: hypothetical protein EOP87_15170 [Verrucomicrobiaceae bacterium]|nr:MAG: hypothetical protein EOP87_15170 [Verrucomicrobiaceae bacterium]
MARRASSSLHPGIILGIIAALAVLFFAGRHFLGKKDSPLGDVEKLDVRDLLENGNSLRGNEYVVEGKIDQQLRWTTSRGQVVSLRVSTPGGEELIGVEIPPTFGHLNIERQQKYAFRVKFRQGGVPVATAINRL